jgi:hypothetical protein
MANADSVGQFNLDSFGNGRIGVVAATSLATSGNAVITIPLLSGGLTAGGAVKFWWCHLYEELQYKTQQVMLLQLT